MHATPVQLQLLSGTLALQCCEVERQGQAHGSKLSTTWNLLSAAQAGAMVSTAAAAAAAAAAARPAQPGAGNGIGSWLW
jgi:hypothetical protein